MRAAAAAGWAAAAILAARGASGTFHAAASSRWLRQNASLQPPAVSSARFVLVVPLLREQAVVEEVTRMLADLARTVPGSAIALVTTQAELAHREHGRERLADLAAQLAAGTSPRRMAARFRDLMPADRLADLARRSAGLSGRECRALAEAAYIATPATPDLAAELATRSWPGTTVRHWHYPHADGRMAHQVNFAVRAETELASCEGVPPDRLFLVLYNADSRPHPDTLRAAAALIARPGIKATRIIQQPAVFTANLASLPATPAGSVLAGAAWLQSRWTLSREIPRLRRQATWARDGSHQGLPTLAHCVGHGLIIRADTLAELGGLPEVTLNEDLALGYLACAAGVPIDPLPLLEEAQTPCTISSWITQGNRWFRSYPQYPRAAALAAAGSLGDDRRRGMLTVQGLGRGSLWLAQSPVLAAALALPALTPRRSRAAALTGAGIVTYYVIPALLAARLADRPFVPLRSVPGGITAALLSSTGPWWSLAELARCQLTGQPPPHRKTER